jgi:thiamine-monophosphate kinase
MKELDLIRTIREKAGRERNGLKLGIGDDCAVIDRGGSGYLLWAADMLVENTHFTAKGAGLRRVGRKAVAVNLSDIAAMGGKPLYITVSLGVPPRTHRRSLERLYDGIMDICGQYDVSLAGGDTVRSKELVIDVSIIGEVDARSLVRRSGARQGELILVTGPVRNGKRTHLDFMPRLDESAFLVKRYRPSSMIDVSDGIAPDLMRICSRSGVGCRLYADAVPLSKGLPLEEALYYGESFELLCTMPVRKAAAMFRYFRERGAFCPFFVAGKTVPASRGCVLVGKEGRTSPLKMEGFRHL